MATSSIKEIWKLVERFKDELELLMSDEALVLLFYISRHEGITKREIMKKVEKHLYQPKSLIEFLLTNKFVEEKNRSFFLSKKAKGIIKVIEYSRYDLSKLSADSILGYRLQQEPIGKGSTCVTFKATKEKMGYDVVLKIFKPGILDSVDLERAIKSLRPLISESSLVIPRDYGTFEWCGLTLIYIEMEYVQGVSLGQFLKENKNVDLEETLLNYIKEVGRTLKVLQDNGFTHGDLHENNILMVGDKTYQERNIFHFKVIDFIGINSIEELRQYELNDIEYFKENFSKIIRKYATTPSGEVDRKKLGERLSFIYENLVQNKYNTFEEVRKSLSEKLPERDKIRFEEPFTYLIFETGDVNQPIWLRRFELESSIYHYFTDFRPLICSGPRGCGKTIYLRSLSFVPRLIKMGNTDEDIRNKIAYFKRIFGIYFACRQGEFKIFSNKLYDFGLKKTELFLKHILVLKIVRRTISLVEEAYLEKIFTSEPKVELILEFLSPYLVSEPLMSATSRERPFKELASILRNEENQCMDKIGEEKKYPSISKLLNEKNLVTFFGIVRNTISELSNFKFYIIFDDLSEPQVYPEMQKILNCLIACHNEVYCCKFSTDKYAYTFEDMFGKALQVPHDYTYLDLSILGDYKDYLERIINRRLELSGYAKGIKDYLERSQQSSTEFILLLSKGQHTQVKFAGWDLVVQLSSWSVRDALVICETIWEQYGGEPKHDKLKEGKDTISVDVQDDALRSYSEEVYAALINIESVGKEVFNIVRNFGEISRQYLKRGITSKKDRQYELIAIERRDNKKISDDASDLLRKIIRHSVFIDRGFSFSREQIGLVQKFVLHKKYTPALKTTYREREHLRLNNRELEMFLVSPDQFTKELLHRLDRKIDREKYQSKLFDFGKDDNNE